MKKLTAVLLVFSLLCGVFCLYANADNTTQLRFNEDGKFTILQLTDPQDDEVLADELVPFIEQAIAVAQPDLIVVTGDLIEDSRPVLDNASDDEPFVEGVKNDDHETALANAAATVAQIFTPLEESGIPYAVTQGNNDYKIGVSNEEWVEIYSQYPNCLTWDASNDVDGRIDYYLDILASGSDDAAFGIWMLDNGKGFSESQMQWMSEYETNGVPGIVFEHVPTDDIGNLFEVCKPWDEDAFADGVTAYRLNQNVALGHAEFAHAPGVTTDAFRVWKEKNVIGAFFGHEHTCGYTGVVDGITMGLTYGCQFAKLGPYGMRTLILDETTGTFTTDLYTYEDGAFSLQVDELYKTYENAVESFFVKMANVFKYIIRSLVYLMKV